MCLMIQHSKTTVLSEDLIHDIYRKNSDGFGVMWGDGEKVHVLKLLGTAQEITDLYNEHILGKDCVIHFRMMTHGDIDYDNCHPYMITENLWMAHNGILSTGNDADVSKSDTWHYIRDFLRPLIAKYGDDILFDPIMQQYIEEHIGSGNKFGIVHKDGRVAILNRKSGVDHMDAWFSNTYAWSPEKFGYKSFRTTTTAYKGYSPYGSYSWDRGWDDEDEWNSSYSTPASTKGSAALGAPINKSFFEGVEDEDVRLITEKAYNCYNKGMPNLRNWVYQAPEKAKKFIAYWYDQFDDYDEVASLVDASPEDAAEWIADVINSDGYTSNLGL